EDAVRRDREPVPRVLGGDCLPRAGNACGRPVAVVPINQRFPDGVDEVRRRLEPELYRGADVQVSDAYTGSLHTLRLGDDVADGIGKAMDTSGCRDGGVGVRRGHDANLTAMPAGRRLWRSTSIGCAIGTVSTSRRAVPSPESTRGPSLN